MQELTASSQNLNDIAEDLQLGISAFKLANGGFIPVRVPAPVRQQPVSRGQQAAISRRTASNQTATQQGSQDMESRRTGTNRSSQPDMRNIIDPKKTDPKKRTR
jgi:hypothetical protein